MQLTVADLVTEGLLSFDGDDEDAARDDYLALRARNRTAIEFFRATADILRSNVPSSFLVILKAMHCQVHDATVAELAPHIGCMRAEDFPEDLRDDFNGAALRAIGRYTVLCIPTWSGSLLTGFFFIHPTELPNGFNFCRVAPDMDDVKYGYAYAKALGIEHDTCFVANDPVVALRLMTFQVFNRRRYTVPVLVPVGDRDHRAGVPVRHPIFLPCPTAGPDYAEWYIRAAHLAGSETVCDWNLGFTMRNSWPKSPNADPTVGHDEVLRWIREAAVDSHKAIGALLLSRPRAAAEKLVMSFDLTGPERARIMTFFTGDELDTLCELLAAERAVATIRLDGDLIEETAAGWMKDRVLISDATVHFTEMRTDASTGESTLAGLVTVRGKAIPFKESYNTLRKGMAAWLDKIVRLNGEWARIHPRWASKLLDIARGFSHSMSLNASDRPSGWAGRSKLVLPRFTVDGEGVRRCVNEVAGPEIPYPVPLEPADYDLFTNQAFCQVFMALVGNLVRTSADNPGVGYAVRNAPHLPERIAAALGVPFYRDATPEDVAAAAKSPLPMFGTWSTAALAALLRAKGPKNVFTSVDEKTYSLLTLEPGWVRLGVESLPAYDALRGIFHLLPYFLATKREVELSSRFHRVVAQALVDGARNSIGRSALVDAGSTLDYAMVTDDNAGTNMLTLLRQLADAGKLTVTTVPEGYRIEKSAVDKVLSSPIVSGSNFKRASYFLGEAKMLAVNGGDYLVVNPDSWNLAASLAQW